MEKSQATSTVNHDLPSNILSDISKPGLSEDVAESRRLEQQEVLDSTRESHPSSSSSGVVKSIPRAPEPKKRPSYLSDVRGLKRGNPPQGVMQKKRRGEFDDADSVTVVRADDLRDPEWMKAASFETASSVAQHGDPRQITLNAESQSLDASKDDRKKHQINYLALELKQNEGILLAKIAAGKEKQKSASMKYGW